MDILAAVLCGLLGLLVGSSLHILVMRSPIHQSLRRVPIHCNTCGTSAERDQRIALLATIRRRGACRTCQQALWPDSPKLEIAAMLLLGLAGLRLGLAWALPAYLVFFTALLVITIVDYRHYIIPTRIVYPSVLCCAVLLALAALIDGAYEMLGQAIIGMFAAWLFFFVVWFIYPRGMGFGDVRLSLLVGLLTGWIGYGNVVLSLLFGLMIGAVVGVVLMILRLRGRKDAIPFGPFLAAGASLSVLFSSFFASSLGGSS